MIWMNYCDIDHQFTVVWHEKESDMAIRMDDAHILKFECYEAYYLKLNQNRLRI